jgi:putative glycerol-1-phosphate prenyltransferase
MDAGSGALHCISSKMIAQVKKQVHLPLIIGGGIRNAEAALNAYKAGADIIVIGNGAEDDKSLIQTIANVRNTIGSSVEV